MDGSSSSSGSNSMKVTIHEIGDMENALPYESIVLKKPNNQNKFGTMFYLKDRLYLKKSTTSVTNYSVWVSEESKAHIVLNYDEDLKRELDLIMDAILKNTPDLPEFKRPVEGDRHFIRLNTKIGKQLETGQALKYILQIYGVFMKSSEKKSYLQLEVAEIDCKPFSLFEV